MIILLPSRFENRSVRALLDRGFAVSTLRFPSGTHRNVAIDVESQQRKVISLWEKFIKRDQQ